MGSLALGGVPANLGNETNRIMSDPLISSQEIEDCKTCPPLRLRAENDDDKDDYDDIVAKRNVEDEEATRIMSKLSSQHLIERLENDHVPLEYLFAGINMEDEGHGMHEEAHEIKRTEFDTALTHGMLWEI